MDNAAPINTFFQKKNLLTVTNHEYQKLVHELIVWLLKTDKVTKDLTTEKLFPEDKTATARVIAKTDTTIAGIEESTYLITTFTKLTIQSSCKDGDQLAAGQEVMKLTGSLQEILAYERFLLNLLQRLSGIATETAKIISKIGQDKPQIAATRKTMWGPLDKKAVAMGGGLTHRLNLSDGILVKDNHLMYMSATDALKKLLATTSDTLIEIEVEDEKQLKELVALFSKKQTSNVLGILLDNFSPEEAIRVLETTEKHPHIIYEASGGITDENISKWAQTGVDIISLGALTHSPKAADISLEIEG